MRKSLSAIARLSRVASLGGAAAAVVAIFVAFSGWSGTKPAGKNLRLASVVFATAIDLKLLIGLFLFFGASPITRAALPDLGEAIKQSRVPLFYRGAYDADVAGGRLRACRRSFVPQRPDRLEISWRGHGIPHFITLDARRESVVAAIA